MVGIDTGQAAGVSAASNARIVTFYSTNCGTFPGG
jgi:hypothetical protein